jgi:hypothetical protein
MINRGTQFTFYTITAPNQKISNGKHPISPNLCINKSKDQETGLELILFTNVGKTRGSL